MRQNSFLFLLLLLLTLPPEVYAQHAGRDSTDASPLVKYGVTRFPPPPPPPPLRPEEDFIRINNELPDEPISVFRDPASGRYLKVTLNPHSRRARYGLSYLDGQEIFLPKYHSLQRIDQLRTDSSPVRYIVEVQEGVFNVKNTIKSSLFPYPDSKSFIGPARIGYLIVTSIAKDTSYLIKTDGSPVTEPSTRLLGDKYTYPKEGLRIVTNGGKHPSFFGLADANGHFVWPMTRARIEERRVGKKVIGYTVSVYKGNTTLLTIEGVPFWRSDRLKPREWNEKYILLENPNNRNLQAAVTVNGDTIVGLGRQDIRVANDKLLSVTSGPARLSGLVDLAGQQVLPAVYTKIHQDYSSKYLHLTDTLGRKGIADPNGKIIIPCLYSGVWRTSTKGQDFTLYQCYRNGLIELRDERHELIYPEPVTEFCLLYHRPFVLINHGGLWDAHTLFGSEKTSIPLTNIGFTHVESYPQLPAQRRYKDRFPERSKEVAVWAIDAFGKHYVVDKAGRAFPVGAFFVE